MSAESRNDRIEALLEVMARLRDRKSGCAWDLEQTFETIAPYTIEEAYEVADAIARDDLQSLKGELGDLLFQVVFHSRMAEEAGLFAFGDVVQAITEKMLRRHPHVFGGAAARTADEQTKAWEEIKAAERGAATSALDGVALALPALQRAQKLQSRAARVGFDWPDSAGVLAKVHEELAELAAAGSNQEEAEEIGDLLFSMVNLARWRGVDAEAALRQANDKFVLRFNKMEEEAVSASKPLEQLSAEAWDALWRAAKLSARPRE